MMKVLVVACAVMVGLAAGAEVAGAQQQVPPPTQPPARKLDSIPPEHMPPRGMCRIWIDGVPPTQQPAPTDCATALKNRPKNGRVIFGPDDKRKPPAVTAPVRSLLPPPRPPAEPPAVTPDGTPAGAL
jgi:hypothetical protein